MFRCPILGSDNLCEDYDHRSESCRGFPIDEQDVADVKAAGGACTYWFEPKSTGALAGPPLGLVRIPEESGPWEFDGCPDLVTVAGRTYLKTGWPMTHHPGVTCQYQETYAEDSRHLYVLRTGTWVVDHIDRWNPDSGLLYAAAHLAVDVPNTGTWIGFGILTLGQAILYIGLGWIK